MVRGYYEGNSRSKSVQEYCGLRHQWTAEDVDVPLMHEKRTEHISMITKEDWMAAKIDQDSTEENYGG